MKSELPSILIIEDDHDIRISLQECIELEGYPVNLATNGKEALELLPKIRRPALMLLDLMMPVMDGRQFLAEIVKRPEFTGIPILLLSAAVETPRSESVVRVLKKPIDLDELMNALQAYAPLV